MLLPCLQALRITQKVGKNWKTIRTQNNCYDFYYSTAGTTAVVAAANSAVAAAGGKDRRHLNGQSVRQHPYPPRT
jgi:hypothetical protein